MSDSHHKKDKHHHDETSHHHDETSHHHDETSHHHDEHKDKVRIQREMPLLQAVAYLEGFLEQLKRGPVSVQNEERSACLTPAEEVFVKVSASQHKGKEKLSLSLHWYTHEVEHRKLGDE